MFTKTVLAGALAAYATATADLTFTSNNKFNLKNAAFVNLGQFDGEDFLLVSTFAPMSSGHVYMVPGVKEAVKNGDVSSLEPVRLATRNFEWPNDVSAVPQDVFGERAIVVPDGFLVPGKKDGGIYIIRMDSENLT